MAIRDAQIPYPDIRAKAPGMYDVLETSVRGLRASGTRVLWPDRYARPYYVAGRLTCATDAPGLIRVETAGQTWTREEHETAARAWLQEARGYGNEWAWRSKAAAATYGNGNGILISGVYRDHFPDDVKDRLRALARAQTFAHGASLAHWVGGARRRVETWRRLRADGERNDPM